MNKNRNIITVETDELGEFDIILNNEQILILAESGSDALSNIKERLLTDQDEEIRSGYWLPDQMGSESIADGFTGNSVDWSAYFSGISNEEIETLIEDAEIRENEIRSATTAGLILLAVGITAALVGYTIPISIGIAQIGKVMGSFFDLDTR